MNKSIEKLIKQRADLVKNSIEAKSALQSEIQAKLDKIFDKSKELKEALKELDASTEYSANEYDICRWVRFEVPESMQEFTVELNTYLQDNHCASLDLKNDALMASCGECIIVNDEGDVFLDQKLIIDSKLCKDDEGEYSIEKRNKLIEEYMEKTGFFPDVLLQSERGDLSLINTKERE